MALQDFLLDRRKLTMAASLVPLATNLRWAHAQEDRPLRVRMSGDLTEADPASVFDPSSHYIVGSMYSRLVRYKPGTTEIEPDLAEDWSISEDGLEYVFNLRKGVTWHKGYGEVTAQDVKYSVERHLDPESRSLFASYFSVLDSVEAVDDYTVKFTLQQPFAPFIGSTLAFRSGWIVNKEAIDVEREEYLRNPIGSGPYQFESWEAGRRVVLTANEDYFEGAPEIKRLEVIPISDDSAAEMALMSGEIDLSYFQNVEAYQRLRDSGQFVAKDSVGLSVHGIMLNMTREPFDSVLVRRALAHAIDVEGIISAVWKDLAGRPTGFLTPNYFGYTDDVEIYEYNPDRARELLAEAGYPDGFQTTFLYSAGAPWPQMAPIIQANFDDIGVETELLGLEFGAYSEPRRAGDYDMISVSTSRPSDPDLILTEYFHSDNVPPGVNNSYYDGVDELIERARVESDPAVREEIYAEVQKQMAIDSPGLWVDWYPDMYVHTPDLEGHAVVMNYDLNPQTMRFKDS